MSDCRLEFFRDGGGAPLGNPLRDDRATVGFLAAGHTRAVFPAVLWSRNGSLPKCLRYRYYLRRRLLSLTVNNDTPISNVNF